MNGRFTAVALALGLVLAGCEEGGRETPPAEPPQVQVLGRRADAEFAPGQAIAVEEQARDRMLQREARIIVEVEDVDSAAAGLREITRALGGRVEQFDQTSAERETPRIEMTVRVPEAELDEAVRRTGELGEVERVGMSAVDVTEEAQDLEVRLRNLRELEDRLLRLLGERTGDLQEVLAVERELARVRTEIERREARLQDLERRVRLATLHAELHEPYPLRERAGSGILPRLGRAFVQAGENLLDFVAWLIAALGYLVPLALIVALAVWWSRRQRRRWMEAP